MQAQVRAASARSNNDSIQHYSIFIKRYKYRQQLELQDKLYRNTGHNLWPGHNTIVYFMFCFVKLGKNITQRRILFKEVLMTMYVRATQ